MYQDSLFLDKVKEAIKRIQSVLSDSKSISLASEKPHRYDDKYLLASSLTNSALFSYKLCLNELGCDESHFEALLNCSQTECISLRFRSSESCKFERTTKRDEESSIRYETEVKSDIFGNSKSTSKSVTTVTEHHYLYSLSYELIAFRGPALTSESTICVLRSRQAQQNIVQRMESMPYPEKTSRQMDVDISWLMRQFNDSRTPSFDINRTKSLTPRRNQEIDAAFDFSTRLCNWASEAFQFIRHSLLQVELSRSKSSFDLSSINADEVFVPTIPVFEAVATDHTDSSSSTQPDIPMNGSTLSLHTTQSFHTEESRSLSEKTSDMKKLFKPATSTSIVTEAEAVLLLVLMHLQDVSQSYQHSVNYIEQMLHNQLIAAIGKSVSSYDFNKYMRYHARKFLRDDFQPVEFSLSVRRSQSSAPEGRFEGHYQQAAWPNFYALSPHQEPFESKKSSGVETWSPS